MKKYLAMILAAVMLVSLSVPAFAAEETPTAEETPAAGSAIAGTLDRLIEVLKKNPRKLIFTEGTDARILEAASRLKKEGFLTPVLIGNEEEVKAAASKGGFDIEGLEIIDPAAYPDMDKLVDDFVELRKGKATAEEARELLLQPNYFGTMLVKEGAADCLLGGATYSTADTVRPALQLIKTRKGANLVSSCMILVRGDEKIAMGDCAINVSYEDKLDDKGNVVLSAAQKVAEVAVETALIAKLFDIDPKIAMLSYSTKGSAKHDDVTKVQDAVALAHEKYPDIELDGELQLDAALVESVGAMKSPGSKVAGHANTLVFPSLEAGNIGYKLVQRLAKANAYGPVLQGLAMPVNDLSRGCCADDIVGVVAMTAVQAQQS